MVIWLRIKKGTKRNVCSICNHTWFAKRNRGCPKCNGKFIIETLIPRINNWTVSIVENGKNRKLDYQSRREGNFNRLIRKLKKSDKKFKLLNPLRPRRRRFEPLTKEENDRSKYLIAAPGNNIKLFKQLSSETNNLPGKGPKIRLSNVIKELDKSYPNLDKAEPFKPFKLESWMNPIVKMPIPTGEVKIPRCQSPIDLSNVPDLTKEELSIEHYYERREFFPPAKLKPGYVGKGKGEDIKRIPIVSDNVSYLGFSITKISTGKFKARDWGISAKKKSWVDKSITVPNKRCYGWSKSTSKESSRERVPKWSNKLTYVNLSVKEEDKEVIWYDAGMGLNRKSWLEYVDEIDEDSFFKRREAFNRLYSPFYSDPDELCVLSVVELYQLAALIFLLQK